MIPKFTTNNDCQLEYNDSSLRLYSIPVGFESSKNRLREEEKKELDYSR
jgi:hypothetical protein